MSSIEVSIIDASDDYENRSRPRLQSLINQYGTVPVRKTIKHRIKNSLKNCQENLNLISIANSILDRLPIIRCVKEYSFKDNIINDIIAGLTIGVMHIPQGIAYGVLAGLTPAHGLYVSFFAVVVYMIFGTCPHLSLGTFAIISLMTSQAINKIPLHSTELISNEFNETLNIINAEILSEKIGIATTLAFFVGLIQLVLSICRLGFITTYLTEPFIGGFNTGAAIQVFSSQIPSIFGVKSPSNLSTAFKLPRFYVKVFELIFTKINWMTTGISASSIVFLFVVKYLNDRYKSKIRIVLPSELILIIIGTIISYFAKLSQRQNVSIVGSVKRGLPAPRAPSFDHVSTLILPSITISAVSLCINISLAKAFAKKHSYKVSSNQELFAYGLANMFSSFFQCYPSSGSLSRSVMQENAGGKTQLTGGFSSIVLLIFILALAPLIESLPMGCLSAIILVNLKGMLYQIKDFLFYFRTSIYECILWSITFLTVVLFDVDIGLYVGVAASFFLNTARTQKPRFAVLGRVGETEFYKIVNLFPSAQQYRNVRILRFYGSLYACNTPFFKRKFYEFIGINLKKPPLISTGHEEFEERPENICQYVILDCSPMNFVDTVGVKMLIEIYNDLKKRDIRLYLSECRYDMRQTLESMDFYKKTDDRISFAAIHDAVLAIKAEITEGK